MLFSPLTLQAISPDLVLAMLKSIVLASTATTATLTAAPVFAQLGNTGVITYKGLEAMAVPLMSGPMMAALGLLLAMLAFRGLRLNQGAKRIGGVVVLVAGSISLSLVGIKDLRALMWPILNPDPSCQGEHSIPFAPHGIFSEFKNNCPNPLYLKEVATNCGDGYVEAPSGQTPECQAEQVIQGGYSCFTKQCNYSP